MLLLVLGCWQLHRGLLLQDGHQRLQRLWAAAQATRG
jgi:hypothetical protein